MTGPLHLDNRPRGGCCLPRDTRIRGAGCGWGRGGRLGCCATCCVCTAWAIWLRGSARLQQGRRRVLLGRSGRYRGSGGLWGSGHGESIEMTIAKDNMDGVAMRLAVVSVVTGCK